MTASRLTAARRARDLELLASGHTVDVLVVGGGVTGVGVALDAASRGLDVALVERDDLAAGTSRWSSKLAHGGLRYIAARQLGVAWESAIERNRLLRTIAPHLIQPMRFVIPIPRVGAAAYLCASSAARAASPSASTTSETRPQPCASAAVSFRFDVIHSKARA